MDRELERYMNDHLAGSAGAVLLIQELIDRAEIPGAADFLTDLKTEVEADRGKLADLLAEVGKQTSMLSEAAGKMAARVGSLKLMWEGFVPGKLGMLEALEMLALGVQGKRLLWRSLNEVAGAFPEWQGTDFKSLERDAIRQRDGVEKWRLWAARQVLTAAGTGDASH